MPFSILFLIYLLSSVSLNCFSTGHKGDIVTFFPVLKVYTRGKKNPSPRGIPHNCSGTPTIPLFSRRQPYCNVKEKTVFVFSVCLQRGAGRAVEGRVRNSFISTSFTCLFFIPFFFFLVPSSAFFFFFFFFSSLSSYCLIFSLFSSASFFVSIYASHILFILSFFFPSTSISLPSYLFPSLFSFSFLSSSFTFSLSQSANTYAFLGLPRNTSQTLPSPPLQLVETLRVGISQGCLL